MPPHPWQQSASTAQFSDGPLNSNGASTASYGCAGRTPATRFGFSSITYRIFNSMYDDRGRSRRSTIAGEGETQLLAHAVKTSWEPLDTLRIR